MSQAVSIMSLERLMTEFLPACESPLTVRNIFNRAPQFRRRREMYEYMSNTLNASGLLSAMEFAATEYAERGSCDQDGKVVCCGPYPSDYAPQAQTLPMNSAAVELVVEYFRHLDPFDSSDSGDYQVDSDRLMSSVERVFKYQHRTFVYAVLFVDDYARVARFDRAGVVASETIDYSDDEQGAALTEFIVRFSRLDKAHRGHDPTAVRIYPHDPLSARLREHARGADSDDRVPKRAPAPPDHVIELFKNSLDDEWPWWRLAVPDDSEPEGSRMRWFAVAKPHFDVGGVAGRGTRGYIAVPLDAEGTEIDCTVYRFVYLKDTWRIECNSEREGDVLFALNAKNIRFVPTLVCHNDIQDQVVTQSDNKCPDEVQEERPSRSYRHYRLVVKEVCKPLSEFKNGRELVFAIFCGVMAHKDSCVNAGYIHGDISAGNILLYPNKNGIWAGILNDWELAKRWKDGKTLQHAQQPIRTGTWQYMSVHALLDAERTIEVSDDIESFFHVLLHFSVRYLPHNIPDALVGHFLHRYFEDFNNGIHGATCGTMKGNSICRGFIDARPFSGTKSFPELTFFKPLDVDGVSVTGEGDGRKVEVRPRHVIDGLISKLLESFKAFYAKDKGSWKRRKAKRQETSAALISSSGHDQPPPPSLPPSDPPQVEIVESHDAVLYLLAHYLKNKIEEWPKEDKGRDKKPEATAVSNAYTDTSNSESSIPITSGLKRRIDTEAQEPLSKRRRSS